MWRRASSSSSSHLHRFLLLRRRRRTTSSSHWAGPLNTSRPFSSHQAPPEKEDTAAAVTKTLAEDVMPIATGLEREEIEAELQGKKRFDMDPPVGPFGTREAPAIIQSFYNKRIVGCPGGEGEDEHDVVWFWLEKDKPHECPVCSQYFVLEVIGEGGDPEGHD